MGDVNEQAVPPMWPRTAGPEYIEARLELARRERLLRDQIEEVAAARRTMPPGPEMPDYVFAEGPADLTVAGPERQAKLSELFGDKDALILYHLMFHPDEDTACPMCSMWVDGFHGVAHHVRQHAEFAVVAKAPLPKLRSWAHQRGWDGLRILSSFGTSFNADLNAEHPDGAQRPMISVFVRDGETVRHFYTLPANFIDNAQRGIDLLSPVWNLLDLLPWGRGEWYAGNEYAGRSRG